MINLLSSLFPFNLLKGAFNHNEPDDDVLRISMIHVFVLLSTSKLKEHLILKSFAELDNYISRQKRIHTYSIVVVFSTREIWSYMFQPTDEFGLMDTYMITRSKGITSQKVITQTPQDRLAWEIQCEAEIINTARSQHAANLRSAGVEELLALGN